MPDPDLQTSASDPQETPAGAARVRGTHNTEATRAFAIEAARLLADSHCEDVLLLDVRGLSQITNFIVVATGTSDRQIKSVGADIAELGRQSGFDKYGTDGDGAATWVVVDMVEVMVHLFEPATRGHYDLEMMWGDAPQIAWRRGA